MLSGEIPVGQIMERWSRLREWHARQQRALEWIALKEYWRAETEQEKVEVASLYGQALERGLANYRRYNLGY